MNAGRAQLLGVFDDRQVLPDAVRSLGTAGAQIVTVLSPIPCPEIEEELGRRQSPIRFFTLFGGLVGTATGLLLTMGASLQYPMITGGKPILSIPPFLVITFELTILFGALATIAGLFWKIRGSSFEFQGLYDPQFSADRFGIRVRCGETQRDTIREMLTRAGALEVRNEEI